MGEGNGTPLQYSCLDFRILPIQDVVDTRFQRALRKAEHERAVQEYDRKHPRKEAT